MTDSCVLSEKQRIEVIFLLKFSDEGCADYGQ